MGWELRRIVYTPGVWDVLHRGHLNVLRRASLCGDYLIAGICSDRLVYLHKGVRPLMGELFRAELVGSLRMVDEVFIYDDADQTNCLKMFLVDTFVIGMDYGVQGVPEHELSLAYCLGSGIEVVRVPRYPDLSSTEIRSLYV